MTIPRDLRRCGIVLAVACAAVSGVLSGQDWPSSSAAAEGLSATPLDSLAARARRGVYGNTDHLLVIANGRVVFEEHFPLDYRAISRGKKSDIGCGIDACTAPSAVHQYNYLHPEHHPYIPGTAMHTLQSVTKSMTATLFGIAIRRGEITSLDAPLLPALGEYAAVATDQRLQRATLADLLTMRTGIEWHEGDRPLDSTNTTIQLEASPDWIRFTLSQPMDAAPREKWVYNSGGSELMAEVIRGATGLHVDAYAERELFGPLGIRYHWKKTPTGHPDTEGGLYLSATDLAKVGQLYLDDGVWQGQRILPAGWAREATARHVEHINANPQSPGYGYQWWRYDRRGVEVWAGNGFGGQFLVILPHARIVAVANGWNVFGERAPSILSPFIDALLGASGVPAPEAGAGSTGAMDVAAVCRVIGAQNARYTAAHVAGDVAAIDALFTPDARSFPPGAPPVVGLPAIHDLTVAYVASGIGAFRMESTRCYGDVGYVIDEGQYAMTYGENVTDRGTYLNVWKRVDGRWKIHANIWNADTASP